MATATSEVQIPRDVLADAHQLRELLIGAVALLADSTRVVAVDAARVTALEARGVSERLTSALDALAAHQFERERIAHQAQAAKHVAPAVSR